MRIVLIVVSMLMVVLNTLAALVSAFCFGLSIGEYVAVFHGFMCLFNLFCVKSFRAILIHLVSSR